MLLLLQRLLLKHEDLLNLLWGKVLVNHFLLGRETIVFDVLFSTFDFKLLLAFFFLNLVNLLILQLMLLFLQAFLFFLFHAILFLLIFLDYLRTLSKDLLELFFWKLELVWVLLVLLLQVSHQHLLLLFV